jgi:hypothetical protein
MIQPADCAFLTDKPEGHVDRRRHRSAGDCNTYWLANLSHVDLVVSRDPLNGLVDCRLAPMLEASQPGDNVLLEMQTSWNLGEANFLATHVTSIPRPVAATQSWVPATKANVP